MQNRVLARLVAEEMTENELTQVAGGTGGPPFNTFSAPFPGASAQQDDTGPHDEN